MKNRQIVYQDKIFLNRHKTNIIPVAVIYFLIYLNCILSFKKNILQVMTVIHTSVRITATNISSCQLIESKWCHHIHANFFADKQTCNLHPMSGITSSWGIRGKGEVLASESGCRAAINRFYSLRPTSETSVSSRMRNTKISRRSVENSKRGKVISDNIDNLRDKFVLSFLCQ